jgi:hypothetical protein
MTSRRSPGPHRCGPITTGRRGFNGGLQFGGTNDRAGRIIPAGAGFAGVRAPPPARCKLHGRASKCSNDAVASRRCLSLRFPAIAAASRLGRFGFASFYRARSPVSRAHISQEPVVCELAYVLLCLRSWGDFRFPLHSVLSIKKAGSPTSRSGVRFALPLTRIPKAGRSCRVGGPAFAFFACELWETRCWARPTRLFSSRLDDEPPSALLLRVGDDSVDEREIAYLQTVWPIATPA